MRQIYAVNFGDTISLSSNEGEKTVCRVSIDQFPEDLRRLHGLDPMQWTVYVRPLPIVYPAPDAPTLYVATRLVIGHGGMSVARDIGGTGFVKASGAGSSIEVRARFVDAKGQTFSSATQVTTCKVNAIIAPGVDAEAEPQLWWSQRQKAAQNAALKLPTSNVNLNQQVLRRLRATLDTAFDSGGGFLQTFDSVNAPVANDNPVTSDPMPVLPTAFDLDFGHQGRPYTKGLWVALSTTEDVLAFSVTPGHWRLMGQLYRLDSGDAVS